MVWEIMGPAGVAVAATASVWTWSTGRHTRLQRDSAAAHAARSVVLMSCVELADAASDVIDATLIVHALRSHWGDIGGDDDKSVLEPEAIENVERACRRLQMQTDRVLPRLPPGTRSVFARYVAGVLASASASVGNGPIELHLPPASQPSLPFAEVEVDLDASAESAAAEAGGGAGPAAADGNGAQPVATVDQDVVIVRPEPVPVLGTNSAVTAL